MSYEHDVGLSHHSLYRVTAVFLSGNLIPVAFDIYPQLTVNGFVLVTHLCLLLH